MNQRGFAIAAVLALGALFMAVALRMSGRAIGDSRAAAGRLSRIVLREACLSGIEIGRWLLEHDPRETDGEGDAWASALQRNSGELDLAIRITDEQSRINASKLVHPDGTLNEPLWKLAADRFPDFQAAQSDIRTFLASRQPTTPLLTPGQLRQIATLTDSETPGAMTVFGTGQINVNSASRDLLNALFDSPETVSRLLSERSREAFRSGFEMKERLGLTNEEFRGIFPLICVSSSCFRIRVEGRKNDWRHHIEAIVQRSGQRTVLVRFSEWSS